mmetsp:Transcript_29156/g.43928  ORF Transcript_29156/g.43928 Transcript_29156/m.43928 type:complete len:83 (+) Transcript_29156:2014-2262(+)
MRVISQTGGGPSSSGSKKLRYHFPLVFKPGQIVGHYEVGFQQRAQYTYKVGREPAQLFFIRRANWFHLQECASHLKIILDNF